MSTSGPQLSSRQQRALSALLQAPSVPQAATAARVGLSTLRRWLQTDAAFQQAYREARRQCVQQAVAVAQRFSTTAVASLLTIARDPEAPASARVSEASRLLDTALKGVEMDDIEQRLQAVEESLFQQEGPP